MPIAISLSLGIWFPMENTQGLKPTLFCVFNGTTEQVAEKLGNLGGIEENWPSVAKATCDSVGFLRGLKPPTPSVLSFSAACSAPGVLAKLRMNLVSGLTRRTLHKGSESGTKTPDPDCEAS